jgi:hypothetical protein
MPGFVGRKTMMGEACAAHKWDSAAARKPLIFSMILPESLQPFGIML